MGRLLSSAGSLDSQFEYRKAIEEKKTNV